MLKREIKDLKEYKVFNQKPESSRELELKKDVEILKKEFYKKIKIYEKEGDFFNRRIEYLLLDLLIIKSKFIETELKGLKEGKDIAKQEILNVFNKTKKEDQANGCCKLAISNFVYRFEQKIKDSDNKDCTEFKKGKK